MRVGGEASKREKTWKVRLYICCCSVRAAILLSPRPIGQHPAWCVPQHPPLTSCICGLPPPRALSEMLLLLTFCICTPQHSQNFSVPLPFSAFSGPLTRPPATRCHCPTPLPVTQRCLEMNGRCLLQEAWLNWQASSRADRFSAAQCGPRSIWHVSRAPFFLKEITWWQSVFPHVQTGLRSPCDKSWGISMKKISYLALLLRARASQDD